MVVLQKAFIIVINGDNSGFRYDGLYRGKVVWDKWSLRQILLYMMTGNCIHTFH